MTALFCMLLALYGDAPTAVEPLSITHHEILIDGKKLAYTVTAGRMTLTREDGTPRAQMFYMAYVLDRKTDASTRPITFSFNGGPGSSSVWLHLGLLGPRRISLGDEGFPPPPPYNLEDNAYSLLDVSDLVFIDPVGTGYSRAAGETKPEEFHGVREDIASVGEFIRRYTVSASRWRSPKFLIGESYGTTRAAGLVDVLQDDMGMYFNGVILVSSILNFQTARFDTGNDLPYILFLPTYTATAYYHGKLDAALSKDLDATLEEVEQFAMGPYADVLLRGDLASPEEQAAVAEKLARYTGLSKDYVVGANLRIHIGRFTKELLRAQSRTVGRLDSRFQGVDRNDSGDEYEYDPSYAAILGPYTGAMNAYVREELGYESDLPYEILTGRVHPWNYRPYNNRYINMAETLRAAMTRNPHLKVMVANGIYDLATPYFATEYTFNHMQLDESLKGNITMTYYPAGHMMYIQQASLARLKEDLARFYRETLQR